MTDYQILSGPNNPELRRQLESDAALLALSDPARRRAGVDDVS